MTQLHISITSLIFVSKSQKRTIHLQAKQVILNQFLKIVKSRILWTIQ